MPIFITGIESFLGKYLAESLIEKNLNFSGIEDQVTFAGMGETFQMWKPETYQSYKAKTSKEAQDNLTKLSWRNE